MVWQVIVQQMQIQQSELLQARQVEVQVELQIHP